MKEPPIKKKMRFWALCNYIRGSNLSFVRRGSGPSAKSSSGSSLSYIHMITYIGHFLFKKNSTFFDTARMAKKRKGSKPLLKHLSPAAPGSGRCP